MELVHGTCSKASKFATEDHDVFSSMPDDVITNIMNRLPIRDAVRTGILSTTWRFKWTTMLSQLVFDEKFFMDFLGAQGTVKYDWRNIIKFLLHLKGSITKFILYLPSDMIFDVENINHWFLFLSGKGIKDVTLKNMHNTLLKLPARQLTHLKLDNCCFDPPPTFRGFPNLLSLDFYLVRFENNKFGELITRCPLLESLRIIIYGEVKQVELVKLENLKLLTMPLNDLDTRPLTSSRIFQLVGSFPKLQELNLNFDMGTFLAEAGDEMDVLATFPCLKTLTLRFIDLTSDNMVEFNDDFPQHTLCPSDLDRNTMGMLQLRRAVFAGSNGSKNEVYLIKFLLARSPLLKKIAIGLHTSSMVDERLEFAEKLLKLHRTSPVAEIDFFYFSISDLSSLLCHMR